MGYVEKLDLMVRNVELIAAIKVITARDWDAPFYWYKGIYYGPPLRKAPGLFTDLNNFS